MRTEQNLDETSFGLDLSGQTLDGRYRVLTALGRGGMGSVYLAEDTRLEDRRVVVKVPHAELLADPAFRRRFQKELESLIRLEHPRVVKVLDSGSFRGAPYAVLQYLAGGSLAERIAAAGGRLGPQQVIEWLPSIAEALDFIHSQGFVHRDLKPANILFDQTGQAFLADFGIAKALGGLETALTQTGHLSGTPADMAPEIARGSGSTVSPAYDQYGLATVVYEALSGQLPHEAGSALQVLLRKLSEPARPIRELLPELPPLAAAVLMRALASDPTDRYPSCTAFRRAFDNALQGITPLRAQVKDRSGTDDGTTAPQAGHGRPTPAIVEQRAGRSSADLAEPAETISIDGAPSDSRSTSSRPPSRELTIPALTPASPPLPPGASPAGQHTTVELEAPSRRDRRAPAVSRAWRAWMLVPSAAAVVLAVSLLPGQQERATWFELVQPASGPPLEKNAVPPLREAASSDAPPGSTTLGESGSMARQRTDEPAAALPPAAPVDQASLPTGSGASPPVQAAESGASGAPQAAAQSAGGPPPGIPQAKAENDFVSDAESRGPPDTAAPGSRSMAIAVAGEPPPLAAAAPAMQPLAEPEQRRSLLRRRLERVGQIRRAQKWAARLLPELGRLQAEGVQVLSLSYGDSRIELAGRAAGPDALAAWTDGLRGSGLFGAVEAPSSSPAAGTESGIAFRIGLAFEPDPAALQRQTELLERTAAPAADTSELGQQSSWLEAGLAELMRGVPMDPGGLDGQVESIEGLALQSGLEIAEPDATPGGSRPDSRTEDEDFWMSELALELRGGQAGLVAFAERLAALSELDVLERLELSPVEARADGQSRWRATFRSHRPRP